jgi:transposase InsO family protein
LHRLLKRDAKYRWEDYQEAAFCALKHKLISRPVLQYPDFSKEFILTTDASNDGAGAVLSQEQIGKDAPIAYASRRFNNAERNYSVVERELAAIVWGIKHFRPYLFGKRFQIVSDHKPLTWIMSVKDPGSRLMRWRILLEEYDYQIIYKPGVQNANADALSRIGALAKENDESDKIDSDLKVKILKENHDSVLGGHRGMQKTYEAIKRYYQWPNMKQELENYVRKCEKCQLNKVLRPKRKAPMEITTTAKHPFERCALDVVGPLTEEKSGNKYILTFQDDLSKFIVAIPIPRQEAETIAKEFVINVVLKFGAPAQVLTDQGSNFLSDLFKNVCKLLKIKKIQTTAFRPESNGSVMPA